MGLVGWFLFVLVCCSCLCLFALSVLVLVFLFPLIGFVCFVCCLAGLCALFLGGWLVGSLVGLGLVGCWLGGLRRLLALHPLRPRAWVGVCVCVGVCVGVCVFVCVFVVGLVFVDVE